jgi:hypothetical protein
MAQKPVVAATTPGLKRDRQRTAVPDSTPFRSRLLKANPAWVVCALMLTHLVLALLTFNPAPSTGGDNAGYVTLANSLLHHQSYRDLFDPAQPPHTQYPPVYPVIIMLGFLVGITSWVGLKLVIVAFSTAAVGLSYLWLRRRREPAVALAVGLLIAVAPGVLDLSHWELSDVPFWAFTMLALWAFERLRRNDDKRFAIAVVAVLLAYFTRTAGLPLVIAALAWFALKRRWRQLAIFCGVIIPPAFAWWLRAKMLAGGSDYVQQFWFINPYQPALGNIGPLDLLQRVVANDAKYVGSHLPILLFGDDNLFFAIVSGTIAVLAVFGLVERLRRPGVPELFFPLYAGLLLIWPDVWSGERFLLPVLPIVLAYAGEALARGVARFRASGATVVGAFATAFILLLAMPRLLDAVRLGNLCTRDYVAGRPHACMGEAWQDFFEVAGWSGEHLPADAVVLSRKARLFYVLSGLKGRNYPMTREPEEFLKEARDAKAMYVVVDHLDDLSTYYLGPVIMRRQTAFCAVHAPSPERTAVLGIQPDAFIQPAASAPDPGQAEADLRVGLCPASYTRPQSSSFPSSSSSSSSLSRFGR